MMDIGLRKFESLTRRFSSVVFSDTLDDGDTHC